MDGSKQSQKREQQKTNYSPQKEKNKMKHFSILTTLAVALATLASCGNEPAMELCDDGSPGKTALPETKDQALVAKAVKARDFFYPKGSRASAAGVTVGHYVTNSSRSATDTVLSVVNFADGRGFVILTDKADSPEILAVSDEGTLSLENIDNPSLKLFVDNAIENLQGKASGIVGGLDPTRPFLYKFENTYDTIYNVEPMIKVHWGQNAPYNNYCPMLPNNKRAYAGCVPIAAAQIMTHHLYPRSFVWDVEGGSTTVAVDWDMINRHITSGTDSIQTSCQDDAATHNVIGMLVRKIGQEVGVIYRTFGSFTTMRSFKSGISYFGYKTSDIKQFGTKPTASFDGSRIWVVGGRDATSSGRDAGHMFLIDGRKYIRHDYKSYILDPSITPPALVEVVEEYTRYYDYVHINWGWDGTSNGYFYNGTYNSRNPYKLDYSSGGVASYNFTSELEYVEVYL